MKKEKFIDPYIKVKSKKSNEVFQLFPNTNIPMPSEIEISESGTCNRKCSFCPRSASDFKDIKEFIPTDLFIKLCKDLAQYNYGGTLRFSGFVEPLLDKNIYNLLNICRKILPEINIEIVTNGDVLSIIRLKKLFSNGLTKLLISVYDGPEDAAKLEKMCKKADLLENQYFIRHRYLPQDQDFGITLSNRSGMMENAEFKIPKLKEKMNAPCFYPSYTFFLDYNGDVLMCPHDWGKKNILGNYKFKDLKSIWMSKIALETRYNLINSNRDFDPCNKCDVQGTFIGSDHANHWKDNNLK